MQRLALRQGHGSHFGFHMRAHWANSDPRNQLKVSVQVIVRLCAFALQWPWPGAGRAVVEKWMWGGGGVSGYTPQCTWCSSRGNNRYCSFCCGFFFLLYCNTAFPSAVCVCTLPSFLSRVRNATVTALWNVPQESFGEEWRREGSHPKFGCFCTQQRSLLSSWESKRRMSW